ncbi:hypothetical protein CRG98_038268 [Punica granatum]|uniref:Uncharacterized protein n=1 Tax=Punica granatum TaxID=22663 RepID=A0A2I0IBL0_PUNGR|nr:hypothetical protein CRG98_038268 [Punica granatum]
MWDQRHKGREIEAKLTVEAVVNLPLRTTIDEAAYSPEVGFTKVCGGRDQGFCHLKSLHSFSDEERESERDSSGEGLDPSSHLLQ